MTDASGVTATGWNRYYEILKNHYERMEKVTSNYTMQIAFTPAAGFAAASIVVSVKGGAIQDFEIVSPCRTTS